MGYWINGKLHKGAMGCWVHDTAALCSWTRKKEDRYLPQARAALQQPESVPERVLTPPEWKGSGCRELAGVSATGDARGWNGTTSEDMLLYYHGWYCVSRDDPARALRCVDAAGKTAPNNFRVKRITGSRERLRQALER